SSRLSAAPRGADGRLPRAPAQDHGRAQQVVPDPEEQPGAEGQGPAAEGTQPAPPAPVAAQQPAAAAAESQPPAAGEAKPAAAAARPARPAREAEPKEAPRSPPPPGSINELLATAVPGVQMKAYTVPAFVGEGVAVEVNRDDVPAVMTAARDDPRLDLK